jgi:predicted DNA-binding transcriptional regulator AlpA
MSGNLLNEKKYNDRELAEALGIPVTTIRAWRASNRGPKYLKMGPKLVFYTASAVEEFLQQGVVEPVHKRSQS